jgi:hypothetical protein
LLGTPLSGRKTRYPIHLGGMKPMENSFLHGLGCCARLGKPLEFQQAEKGRGESSQEAVDHGNQTRQN